MYFVVRQPALTIVKAGKFAIEVLAVSEPYLGDPAELSKGFNDEPVSAAWREHGAWIALDLRNEDVPKKQAYRVFAKLAAELLDVRCAGIYLPKETSSRFRRMGRLRSICGGCVRHDPHTSKTTRCMER